MASRVKKGIYGMTVPKVENVLGTTVVQTPRFNNMMGEIISVRNDHMQYLTIQIQSEYRGRVYIVNLLESQCADIRWRS